MLKVIQRWFRKTAEVAKVVTADKSVENYSINVREVTKVDVFSAS